MFYLYGTINNRTGWVNAKDLTAPTAVKPTTSAAKDYNYTYVIKMVMVLVITM